MRTITNDQITNTKQAPNSNARIPKRFGDADLVLGDFPAKRGLTLVEVMIASLITSVVAAGTFMAFVTAARMGQVQNDPQSAEAAGFAQQTIERFRSFIACSPAGVPASPWFDASCAATLPAGWQNDPLPAAAGAGSKSILNTVTARRYCVKAVDCDGNGTAGDCFSMKADVCWNGTACPAVGAAC